MGNGRDRFRNYFVKKNCRKKLPAAQTNERPTAIQVHFILISLHCQGLARNASFEEKLAFFLFFFEKIIDKIKMTC